MLDPANRSLMLALSLLAFVAVASAFVALVIGICIGKHFVESVIQDMIDRGEVRIVPGPNFERLCRTECPTPDRRPRA